jgi:hypothetical protein
MLEREHLELYASFLFLKCAAAVRHIVKESPSALSESFDTVFFERHLRRELGILLRYWISHDIWEVFEDDSEGSRELNLLVLRHFTRGLKLPKDGSGLKYAELSTLKEQLRELCHRLTAVLGKEDKPFFRWVESHFTAWRKDTREYVETLKGRDPTRVQAEVAGALNALNAQVGDSQGDA